jgi:hypothetical protein
LQYLEKIIYLTQDHPAVLIFLEAVQKYDINKQQYITLLKCILEYYENKRKLIAQYITENQLMDWQLDRFFIYRDTFYEKIRAGNMKDLVEYAMS